jgi:hypothetical protein
MVTAILELRDLNRTGVPPTQMVSLSSRCALLVSQCSLLLLGERPPPRALPLIVDPVADGPKAMPHLGMSRAGREVSQC